MYARGRGAAGPSHFCIPKTTAASGYGGGGFLLRQTEEQRKKGRIFVVSRTPRMGVITRLVACGLATVRSKTQTTTMTTTGYGNFISLRAVNYSYFIARAIMRFWG